MKRLAWLIAAWGALACEVGPAGPSADVYPDVGGTYAGTVKMTFAELGFGTSCPASTVVGQTGPIVSIAPLVLGSDCGGGSIPVGSATLDAAGRLLGTTSASFSEPGCPTYTVSGTGQFSSRELRLSLVATSARCWSLDLVATLTREAP